VAGISPPGRLAESLAGFYLAGYGGLSQPVIGPGILAAAPVLVKRPERVPAPVLVSAGSRDGGGDG
jgi:hypothetical protein